MATSATGAKSLSGSKGRFLYSHALITCGVPVKSSVWPSGRAFATKSAPIVPPAPGLFSTNTCSPMAVDSRAARIRAGTSANPPGDSGTTMRTGRFGQVCADAAEAAASSAAASALKRR